MSDEKERGHQEDNLVQEFIDSMFSRKESQNTICQVRCAKQGS